MGGVKFDRKSNNEMNFEDPDANKYGTGNFMTSMKNPEYDSGNARRSTYDIGGRDL